MEALHHRVALLPADAAVDERCLEAIGFLYVLLQDGPHLGELAEHQHPVTGGQYLVEDFLQAGQLAGAAVDAELSPSSCRGWLQACLSLVRVSRMEPRRSMPSADSSRVSASRSTA